MKKILVPLDGSKLAERALPYAAVLARRTDADLLLLEAVPAGDPAGSGASSADVAEIAEADADLAFAARRLRASGLAVEARLAYGPAAAAIVDEARFAGVDMVVMATHGRSGPGRWIYGSVADQVLRTVETPILLVPPGAPGGWGAGQPPRVVVPLDGSEVADVALEPAVGLAAALDARLVLLRVVEPFYYGYRYGDAFGPIAEIDVDTALAAARSRLDQVAARLRERGQAVEVRAEVGPPAATIAAVAHEVGASAIALATHGRGGLARAVMGSVATGLLSRADAPILLVRPAARARAAGRTVSTAAMRVRTGATG